MATEAVPAASSSGLAGHREQKRGRTAPRSANALLFVLCGVLYLDGLDVSLAGVTLPSIQRDLGLGASQLQWIVSAYVLGYGGLLLLGGRAADLFGRRRVLLAGLGVFGTVSLLSGLTSTAGVLIAARFIKGAATALTAPAGLSIVTIIWHLASTPHYTTTLLPAMVLIGTGIGMCFPAVNLQATHSLPEHEQGAGAAILQSSLQLGGAVMVSITAAVIGSPASTGVLAAYRNALSLVTGTAVLGLVLTVLFALITFTSNKED